MIDASMHGTCRYPSIAWRTYPDMRSEVIRAGLALALFPASPDKPIWRRSPLYVLTYFAPVSLPLLALIVTPLTWPMAFGGTGLDNTTKVLLALSSMVWAAWAIAFFSYFGERDFLVPWRVRQKERFANATTELLGFPNRHARNLAAEFFADKGPTAFNLMALVVVPAFAGYIGLFSAPDKPSEPAAPVVNETHISLSSTQCEISPSAVANVSLSASGTANISLKGKFSRRTKAVGCETGTAASAPSLQTSEPPHSASSTASAPFEVDTTAPSVR
ncbi:hypothetical protein [Roseateles sp.]|uniref:hypothetical protein n=1 Tax=Roseateles sp. TaxID=1971397 RepID=UPI003D0A130A